MNSRRPLKVLLVIPLYNHANTVAEVVKRALETGHDVLVVDDGSLDDGLKVLNDVDCHTLRLSENRGKGAAILAGARFASEHSFDAILTIDADGQHDPADSFTLITEGESGIWPAVIIGARQMVQDTVPGASHFGKKFSNFWVRLESGKDLQDTQSGMRLYPVRELLQLETSQTRYDFEIEVLVKFLWAGLDARDVDISVHYPPAGERVSHFDKIVDNWRLTKLHTRLVCRRLLPRSHTLLVPKENRTETSVVVKNPLQTLKNICRENSSPFWLGVAVWVGIFFGALPLIACHTVVIIYVAFRFHLNKVAAVAASQFCMPPIVPALCIEVGYFLRTGEFLLDFSWDRWILEVHLRLWDWFIGSLLVGPLLGLLFASVVYWGASKICQKSAQGQG